MGELESLGVREQRILEESEKLRGRFEAIQQGRTDFALEHFVVGQHDTPPRQWAQAVLELQTKAVNIERARLDIQEKELELAEAREGRGHRANIQCRRLELDIWEIELAMLGAVRESETLLAITSRIETAHGGQPFTHQELQEAEADYWAKRLTRQLVMHTRPAAGDAEAILQMLTEPGQEKPRINMGADELAALLPLASGGSKLRRIFESAARMLTGGER